MKEREKENQKEAWENIWKNKKDVMRRVTKKPRKRLKKDEKEKEDLAASTELRGWFTKKNEKITANNKIENIKRSLGILENNIEKEEFKKDEEHKKKRKHFQDIKEVFETKETKKIKKEKKPDDHWIKKLNNKNEYENEEISKERGTEPKQEVRGKRRGNHSMTRPKRNHSDVSLTLGRENLRLGTW